MMTRMDCLQFAYDIMLAKNSNIEIDELIELSEKIYRYVNAIPWSGSGFVTEFSDPETPAPGVERGVTTPPGVERGVTFSSSGDDLVGYGPVAAAGGGGGGHGSSPYVSAYPRSGFGTKFSGPGTIDRVNV